MILAVKIYSPKERLLALTIPNLFTYATKELSQDAFLCWTLEWINFRGHRMCEFARSLLNNFLAKSVYKDQINPLDIDTVEIKRQYKNIDVLVLVKLKNDKTLPIIIEDKTDTTLHDKQIQRYTNTIKSECTDFPTPVCVFYKTGYIFEPYSEIETQQCIVYDKSMVIEIMKQFEDFEMPLLFCDYYAYLVSKQNKEDAIIAAYDKAFQSGDVTVLLDTLNIDFAQWELMKKLTSKIEKEAEKNIRKGNNPDGAPWTQYDVDDSYLKGNDEAFYRIDKNSDGYYLSLRQYLKYDTEKYMQKIGVDDKTLLHQGKMTRLELYRRCFAQAVKELKPDMQLFVSNRGAYESDIGTFRFDSVENLLWIEQNLGIVTNRFLQLVQESS